MSILISRGEESIRFHQQFPGPFLLVDASKGFTFRYDGGWRFMELKPLDQPIIQSFELEVKSGENAAKQCEEERNALDVTELMVIFHQLSAKVQQFLNL